MPDPMYTGNPGGGGNPPGKYSEKYLNEVKSAGHFVTDASYRGSMHIGMSESASNGGNQPKQNSQSSLESFANKEESI